MAYELDDAEELRSVKLPSNFTLDRRAFAFGALSAAAMAPEAASAKRRTHENYKDFDATVYVNPYTPLLGGSGPASSEEEETANRILRRAHGHTPLRVMLYFEALRTVNHDGEAYNGGWKDRANPVILAFLRGVRTDTWPLGDRTSWCAASLNWVLQRAGYEGGTGSPLSGSFREAPGRTDDPKTGDIVVFRDIDQSLSDQGFGHVCLYLRQTNSAIFVLGGNQKNVFGHQAVCRKWIRRNDETFGLTLHSFHSIEAFKRRAA
jgi:uncharacterized protein (TIGR02594 family)